MGKNLESAITEEHSLIYLQCLIHTLQLAIQDAKQETPVEDIMLAKARSTIKRPHLQLCKMMKPGGTQYLQHLLEIKQYTAAYLVLLNSSTDCLSSKEWAISERGQVLDSTKNATNDLSGNKYATRSMVIPFLHFIDSSIEKSMSKNEMCSVFARNLMKALKSRFPFYKEGKTNVTYIVLDPHFKMTLKRSTAK
ncbi:hypothetical protein PR048_023011 [Dryococelus australis]|uniref:Uncharacterized protein n=1 Tax=Dryococelus australis TaxID=614101 RepID=A0ABQ9GSY7_9NEOP|nr:hypothetical protein PR048_023011 [Dryococelus australis]